MNIMSLERPTPNSARARRAYAADPEEITATVEKAIEKLPRWTLENSTDGEIHATRRTGLFRFIDDVTVQIVEKSNGTEVHFESVARVGKGDLGQNPRNLAELLEAIDQQLD